MQIEDYPLELRYESEEDRIKERTRLLEQAALAVEALISHCGIYKTPLSPYGELFHKLQQELDLADAELEAVRLEKRHLPSMQSENYLDYAFEISKERL